MAGSKKGSYWAQYQSLLVRRPFFMNITQGGLLTAAGNAVAQTLTEGTVKAQPLIEQVLDVALGAGEVVVDAKHVGAIAKQAVAEVGAEEAGASGYQYAFG